MHSVSTRSGKPKMPLPPAGEVGLLIHSGGLCSKQFLDSLSFLSLRLLSCLSLLPLRAPSSIRAASKSSAGPGLQAAHLVLFLKHRQGPPGFSIVFFSIISVRGERKHRMRDNVMPACCGTIETDKRKSRPLGKTTMP